MILHVRVVTLHTGARFILPEQVTRACWEYRAGCLAEHGAPVEDMCEDLKLKEDMTTDRGQENGLSSEEKN